MDISGNILGTSQPDNGGCSGSGSCENAAAIMGNQGNCLNDLPGTSTQLFICEYEN